MAGSIAAQQYHTVGAEDYDGHDDSATEVSDSNPLSDEEECWHEKGSKGQRRKGNGRPRRIRAVASSLRGVLDTVLLLVVVGLLLERRSSRPLPPSQATTRQLEGSGDITGFAPRSEPPSASRSMLVAGY